MKPLERLHGRHISIVNNILSWEKEVATARTGHREGAALRSAVKMLVDAAGLTLPAAKRVLWQVVREWEAEFDGLVAQRLSSAEGCSPALCEYMEGLRNQMVSLLLRRYVLSGREQSHRSASVDVDDSILPIPTSCCSSCMADKSDTERQ